MVRAFSNVLKKPAGWVPPSAPLSQRKQVFLYVHTDVETTKANRRAPQMPLESLIRNIANE